VTLRHAQGERVGVYPGTFDPPTLGHFDIIGRAARLVDRLVVGVTTNPSKSPLFTLDERMALIRDEAAAAGASVEVVPFDRTLLVDFARAHAAAVIVRGLRSGTDFDYELQMAGLNARLAPELETVFLAAAPALQPIASSLVKEIARLGGDVTGFVTPAVRAAMTAKLAV
jgi:pantetheine-phosphate adenylyltransferase